jgi:hypothetical protein
MELKRDTKPIRMRNYGRIVQDMIAYAATLPAGKERDSLELYIAQCMRQRNLVWNRDQEAGMNRVKEDLIRLSDGKLRCESAAFGQLLAQPNASMKASKKKK